MEPAELNLWIEMIKSDEIVLTDGEYRFTLEVLNSSTEVNKLPELFQEATIRDQYQLEVSSFEPNAEDSETETGED